RGRRSRRLAPPPAPPAPGLRGGSALDGLALPPALGLALERRPPLRFGLTFELGFRLPNSDGRRWRGCLNGRGLENGGRYVGGGRCGRGFGSRLRLRRSGLALCSDPLRRGVRSRFGDRRRLGNRDRDGFLAQGGRGRLRFG